MIGNVTQEFFVKAVVCRFNSAMRRIIAEFTFVTEILTKKASFINDFYNSTLPCRSGRILHQNHPLIVLASPEILDIYVYFH